MRRPWHQRFHRARPRPRAPPDLRRGRAAFRRDARQDLSTSRRSCRDVRGLDAGQQSRPRHALGDDRSGHPFDLFLQVSGQFEKDNVRQQGVIRLEAQGQDIYFTYIPHFNPAVTALSERRRQLHGAGAQLGLQLHPQAQGRRVRRRDAGHYGLRALDAGRHREVVAGARARRHPSAQRRRRARR